MILNLPTPLQQLDFFPNLQVSIKRDDLIHPVVAGNKWRKLAGYVEHLPASSHVITFGGAHSNHLAAAASVLADMGHTGTFVIRGEELHSNSSEVLRHCHDLGMQLIFISRAEFRALRDGHWQPSQSQLLQWQTPSNSHILAEGGSGEHNQSGCAQLWQELVEQGLPDQLWLAAGTGGTARGLLHAMPEHCQTKLHIISAVKGAQREAQRTLDLAQSKAIPCTWQDENVFGGFAKSSPELAHLHNLFSHATDIPLDPVYNTKVCWHLQQLSLSKPSTSDRIVWLHTGGFGLNNPTTGT